MYMEPYMCSVLYRISCVLKTLDMIYSVYCP